MKKINLWHDSPLINKNSQKLRAHIIETTSYFMDKKSILHKYVVDKIVSILCMSIIFRIKYLESHQRNFLVKAGNMSLPYC